MRITGSTSRTPVIAKAVSSPSWRGSGGSRRYSSNRPRHPAEDAADQPGRPCQLRCRFGIVGRNAARVKIFHELDVVRFGDGEFLVAEKYRVFVKERPEQRHGGRCRAVFR